MSDTCKFCGAAKWYGEDSDGAFECQTDYDYSWRSSQCKVATLARYEAIFQTVMPDDPGPITAEVCERLGLLKDAEFPMFYGGGDLFVIVEFGGFETSVRLAPWCKTAGQLACLIAARKGAVK